jgi:hypothetical protein
MYDRRVRAILLLIAGCATHDVLHSEAVVHRAACSGGHVGIFGHPGEDRSCLAEVVSLGDGCYLAVRPDEAALSPRQILHVGGTDVAWQPHLYQCAANAPDHHVMCVEDYRGRRDDVFGDDIVRNGYKVTVPYEPEVAVVYAGRCRAHLDAWELAHLPPPDPVEMVVTHWLTNGGDQLPHLRVRFAEDPISLERELGPMPEVVTTACPGGVISFQHHYSPRLAGELQQVVARAIAEGGFTVATCTELRFGLDPLLR